MAAVDAMSSSPPPVRPPPLTQSDAITSLLSLSIAAADGGALPVSALPEHTPGSGVAQSLGAANSMFATSTNTTPILPTSVGASSMGKHHRRLGSMGQTKRRLSDAREASVRPILGTTPTSSAALSLSALSLSTSASGTAASPPRGHAHSHSLGHTTYPIGYGHGGHAHSHSHGGYTTLAPRPANGNVAIISGSSAPGAGTAISRADSSRSGRSSSGSAGSVSMMGEGKDRDDAKGGEGVTDPIPIAGGKAKKRGVEYKCESCNKIYRHPNCLNKHRWEHTRQWREASKFVLSKHQQVQLLEAAAILSFMGKDPTSLPEDRSEWPTFLSGGRLPKVGDPEDEDVHSAPGPGAVPVSGGYGLAHYPSAGARTTTKTYALQPISSSVPNPSGGGGGGGPRMHDYSIRAGGGGGAAGGVGGQAVQVAPGLMGVRTPVMASSAGVATMGGAGAGGHAIIGGSSVPASASASIPVSVVTRSVSGASSSRRSDSKSSTTSSGSASEDVDIDIDIDIDGDEEDLDSTHRGVRVRRPRRRDEHEHDIEVDVESMEEGDVDEEEGRGVVSVRPMSSRVRWEKEAVIQQQQQQLRVGQVDNNGVYGSSAPGYGYAPSSYSSTGSVGYSPGYGVGSYGARRGGGGGMAMKREEDEMSVSFSVREEDEEEEEEAEDEAGGTKRGWSSERRWDGMEMEVDMDMD